MKEEEPKENDRYVDEWDHIWFVKYDPWGRINVFSEEYGYGVWDYGKGLKPC